MVNLQHDELPTKDSMVKKLGDKAVPALLQVDSLQILTALLGTSQLGACETRAWLLCALRELPSAFPVHKHNPPLLCCCCP